MGTKSDPGSYDCYANVEDDEPIFVLCARDASAPNYVRSWAVGRIMAGNKNYDKIVEALKCADAMDEWRRADIAEKLSMTNHEEK